MTCSAGGTGCPTRLQNSAASGPIEAATSAAASVFPGVFGTIGANNTMTIAIQETPIGYEMT